MLDAEIAPRDSVIDHDVRWLLAACDTPDKHVLRLRHADGREVALFVHEGWLDFVLGEISIGKRAVRRHVLVGNFDSLSVDDWGRIFARLGGVLKGRSTVFLLGVVDGESLDLALAGRAVDRNFRVLRHGLDYERRLCMLGVDLDAYLASLPAGRRQDLRRSLRRFEREFAGRQEFSISTKPEEVESFLLSVEAVSAKTYQARLRGLGVSRDGHVGHKAIEAARLGLARCYLLRVDGKPVAWRIGFVHGDTFFSHHVGYDPAYEAWHPGVVMHLRTVADLSAQGFRQLDMLYGDNAFKRKAANLSRTERNVYLFPRNVQGTASFLALAVVNRVSGRAGELLDRYGVKERLRRWLRRAARDD